MNKILYPDMIINSTCELDTGILHEKGIKGIILDMDNTLAVWGSCAVEPHVCDWIETLKEEGFKLYIVSNSTPSKGSKLAEQINVPAVWYAVKPCRKPFRIALSQMGLTARETAVIGDQIFTDVLGGNRLGMFTILVPPLAEKDFIWTKLMRIFEKKVFTCMEKEQKIQ